MYELNVVGIDEVFGPERAIYGAFLRTFSCRVDYPSRNEFPVQSFVDVQVFSCPLHYAASSNLSTNFFAMAVIFLVKRAARIRIFTTYFDDFITSLQDAVNLVNIKPIVCANACFHVNPEISNEVIIE